MTGTNSNVPTKQQITGTSRLVYTGRESGLNHAIQQFIRKNSSRLYKHSFSPMPLSKTPEIILSEFEQFRAENYPSCIGIDNDADEIKDWLRSSMQSLLLHVMGEAEKCKRSGSTWYNMGVTDCVAVIQSTIDSIKE